MRTKCNLDESAVIRDYKQFGCARACAEKYGVSNQTIYRILIRNDIPRKKPKEDKERVFVSNCKSKYCPALIVMLRTVCELSNNEIAAIVKAKNISSVCNIISRRVLQKEKPVQSTDVDMDKLEAEYIAGASTYELGEKYGVYHSTISKWMKQRGHVRGKCFTTQKGTNAGHDKLKQLAIERDKQRLLSEGGKIELIEYSGYKSTYRCTDCGLVFTRCRGYKRRVVCPDCYSREIAEQKAINDTKRKEARKKSEQARAEEYAKDKICVICGSVFHSERKNQKACSDRCRTTIHIRRQRAKEREATAVKQKAELQKDKICAGCGCVFHSKYKAKKYCDKCAQKQRHCDHKVRAERYGVEYDPSITLDALIERDGNICKICGELCDKDDRRWKNGIGPLYPTIDHIIAMVNGGSHTWGNVQLAHAYCNCAIKRDLTEEELTEEVITHAKEQAITHKCA